MILKDLAAAIVFFTRIPVWKIYNVPPENYTRMIYFWPFTGWITSGITVAAWLAFSAVFPPMVAVILALLTRILVTGALHEDGLGDFLDGFGGGKSKEAILRIMKDSHTGSFALVGLIFYFVLLIATLQSIPEHMLPLVIFAADPFSKFAATIMMNILPYARPDEESKTKISYLNLKWWQFVISAFFGLMPVCFLGLKFLPAIIAGIVIMLCVTYTLKKRIKGYTGDTCGATALMVELGFYLTTVIIITKML